MKKPVIGLFGTCGSSTWRDKFIDRYNKLGFDYFNPQKENWNEKQDAVIEAEHLANDEIILFPVTNETYAAASLAETGFYILNAIGLDNRRDFVVMIDSDLDKSLNETGRRKDSLRTRAILKEHIKKQRLANLYLVDSLDEMLEVSIHLYEAAKIIALLKRFNPHRRV